MAGANQTKSQRQKLHHGRWRQRSSSRACNPPQREPAPGPTVGKQDQQIAVGQPGRKTNDAEEIAVKTHFTQTNKINRHTVSMPCKKRYKMWETHSVACTFASRWTHTCSFGADWAWGGATGGGLSSGAAGGQGVSFPFTQLYTNVHKHTVGTDTRAHTDGDDMGRWQWGWRWCFWHGVLSLNSVFKSTHPELYNQLRGTFVPANSIFQLIQSGNEYRETTIKENGIIKRRITKIMVHGFCLSMVTWVTSCCKLKWFSVVSADLSYNYDDMHVIWG